MAVNVGDKDGTTVQSRGVMYRAVFFRSALLYGRERFVPDRDVQSFYTRSHLSALQKLRINFLDHFFSGLFSRLNISRNTI